VKRGKGNVHRQLLRKRLRDTFGKALSSSELERLAEEMARREPWRAAWLAVRLEQSGLDASSLPIEGECRQLELAIAPGEAP
jgi:hypothetical protein